MKTKSALVATLVAVSFLVSNLSFAQNYKIRSLQNNSSLTMTFFRTDTVLVVVPNSVELTAADKEDIESYVYWEENQNKPVYKYKPESEVGKTDRKKHLLFYGSLNDFQRKDLLKVPVKKCAKGFWFNDRIFDLPTDAFLYINEQATRMYVCRNSNQAKHELLSVGIGMYPLHIFRGNEIVITGVYQPID